MKQASAFEPRSRARRRALQALYQWQITGQEAAEILRQFRAVQDMKGVDEAYFEALLCGIVAGQEGLDDALQPFLDRPIGQVDLMERVVLRIGAFELLNCPELPFRVVLDECVDLAHPLWFGTGTQLRQRRARQRGPSVAQRRSRAVGSALSSMPEFDLIRRLQEMVCSQQSPHRSQCILGIGDDAAVLELPVDRQLVVCTDSLVEGVHFPATNPRQQRSVTRHWP